MKKILFVASECVPFIKTGGLADVAGELPKYIDKKKYDVRVFLPYYKCIDEKYRSKARFLSFHYIDLGWRHQYVGIFEYIYDGMTYYFIDNEFYYSGDKPYGDTFWDIEKFAFFSKAVLSSLSKIGFKPDIIHCNDWQTALIPVYLKTDTLFSTSFYKKMKTIMTIHNLKFQGMWEKEAVKDLTGLSDDVFVSDRLDYFDNANLLKGGIVFADYVTTVSKMYAKEIQGQFYGEGLDELLRLRSDRLVGIVNGIDYNSYDPMTDKYISHHFDEKSFRTEKKKNKRELQKALGLLEDDKKFLVGIVSRLTDQKGFDLIDCVMDEICDEDVQLVVLGSGDPRYENMFRHYEWKYKGRVSANICYDNGLAHKIYSSCDAFLMPSLFEPCGLSQIMSMRYGTVPIVRATGGLADTVTGYEADKDIGTGFMFWNYNAHEMLDTLRYAKQVFFNKKREWNKIVERAMMQDFSWNDSARKYEELYQEI